MKKCDYCKKFKEKKEFHKHKKNGLQSTCKKCKAIIQRIKNKKHCEAQKRYYEKNRDNIRKKRKLFSKNKQRIRSKSKWLYKAGKIKKKRCKVCNSTESEMHHLNYKNPFDIIWLCKKHHGIIHSKN